MKHSSRDMKEQTKKKSAELKRGNRVNNDQDKRRKRKMREENKLLNDKMNYKMDIEYQAADVDKVKESNVVFFNGTQLKFILRDQTLEKLFLSLCNLCSLCIGSSVTPI